MLIGVIAVITLINEKDLPFRGDDKIWHSSNNESFIEIIELLNKSMIWISFYKSFWRKVKIQKTIKLSKNLLEFIKIIGKQKQNKIVNGII